MEEKDVGRSTAKSVSPSIRRVTISAQTVEDPLSLSKMFEVSENAVIVILSYPCIKCVYTEPAPASSACRIGSALRRCA